MSPSQSSVRLRRQTNSDVMRICIGESINGARNVFMDNFNFYFRIVFVFRDIWNFSHKTKESSLSEVCFVCISRDYASKIRQWIPSVVRNPSTLTVGPDASEIMLLAK